MSTERERFNSLVASFKKADTFYADPKQPQAKKDAWRPKMEALVDELAALYQELLAEGKVTSADLPEATEDTAKMIFNGRMIKP